jgi:hypothetical protein
VSAILSAILYMGEFFTRNGVTVAGEKQNQFLSLVLGLATLLPISAAIAQATRPRNSWLDRPLTNWNKDSSQ